MDTTNSTPDEPLLRGKRKQNLQDMLKEVGLAVEYWLPKLQEHLGVTCAQGLQHLEKKTSRSSNLRHDIPGRKGLWRSCFTCHSQIVFQNYKSLR